VPPPRARRLLSGEQARRLLSLDRALLVALRTRGHSPQLERAARLCSRAGEHAACWVALGLAGAWRDRRRPQRRRRWLQGVAVVAGSYAANYAVKLAVARRRPQLEGLPALSPVVSGLSFPSAHATTSFAAARAYSSVAPAGALYAAAGLLGLTRPYLGVHYPSDVLAGALLGSAIAAAAEGALR